MTIDRNFKTPKIHLPICSLSVMALVLLASTVSAAQNALAGEVVDYLHSQKHMQQKPKPTLKELGEACGAIVRKDTNERLTNQASESHRQHFRKYGEPHVHLGVCGDLFTSVTPPSRARSLL
jgi:hypothetical protein